MSDGVTLWRRLSLAGHKPRISPAFDFTTVNHATLTNMSKLITWINSDSLCNRNNDYPNNGTVNSYRIHCTYGLQWVNVRHGPVYMYINPPGHGRGEGCMLSCGILCGAYMQYGRVPSHYLWCWILHNAMALFWPLEDISPLWQKITHR